MEETTRQALGAAFIALASAGGEGALEQACATITAACDSGAVSDPAARDALRTLVRSCVSSEIIDALVVLESERAELMERLSPETPRAEILALIGIVDRMDDALGRLAMAAAPTTINTRTDSAA
jgi:hypothetical protein